MPVKDRVCSKQLVRLVQDSFRVRTMPAGIIIYGGNQAKNLKAIPFFLIRQRRKRSETGETDLEVTVNLNFQKNTSLDAVVVASTLQNGVEEFGLEGLVLVAREGATVTDTYIEDAGTD